MVTFEFVQGFLTENLQNVTFRNTEFNARCPICNDSQKNPRKKRFYLKYTPENGGVYNCFNCGKSGNFIDLYSRIKGISSNQAFKEVNNYNFSNLKESLKKKKQPNKKETEVLNIPEFSNLKRDWTGLDETQEGIIINNYKYILRKFVQERRLPKNYPFYIAYKGDYKNRIIIPIFGQYGEVIYFQGRATNSDIKPKYLNPSLSDKKMIIMNLHKFDPYKYIIITEGPLDAILVGNQGTCVFGSTITDKFLEILMKKTNKGIIVALDNDETGIKETMKIINKSNHGKKLFYFTMPDKKIKDINQLVIEKGITEVYGYIAGNSTTYLEYTAKIKLQ